MFHILSLISILMAPAVWQPSRAAIAEHYAPVIYQATGRQPKADAITRVDFDGNLDATDNWESLPTAPTPAHVYSSVIESETHYFITYGFFHPRDYSRVCAPVVCHENDFEGALFTVKKGDASNPLGTLVLVETIAHLSLKTDWAPTFVPDPVDGHLRVALYIEAQGHGVHTWHDQPLDAHRLFVYAPGAVADVPGVDDSFPRAGTFSYTLLSIERELWDRRELIGDGALFNKNTRFRGARFEIADIPLEFNGNNFLGLSKPQAPWGWRGGDGLKAGEVFLDPALAVARHGFSPSDFSLTYVHNAFVGILSR